MALTESHVKGPGEPVVHDMTIGDLLKAAAEQTPDRLALITGVANMADRRQWTYAELWKDAQRTARALCERFEPGERIAVWAPNIPEWVILEFGAALSGVILVTVNPAFQPTEVAYVLNQSRSAGIFVVPEFRGNQMLATIDAIRPDCPELREVIPFDGWELFLKSGEEAEVELPDVKPNDPVMIQYTSGTTGFPKGALLHHRGLVNNGAHTLERMGVAEGSVYITTMPLFHTGGCVVCVLGAVARKATQVLVEMFDPGLVLELAETYQASSMLGVPTMLVAMMEHPTFPNRDLSSVQYICSGGSTVPAPVVKQFERELGAKFTIVFGQTECSPVASMTYPHDTPEDKAGTIGAPMPNVEIKIVDPETNETLPIGDIGEFCTRGYHVMHNYFEMPEATEKAIDADGWLHTGDLCAMDERGYCTVEGRLKDMIIRGGENIYPRELEDLLYAHEAVGDVAVVGLPDDKWGEVVGAFIRPAPGHNVEKEKLYAYMRANLSPQKTPQLWFAMEEFPLTGSGKIQKFKLREQWQNDEFKAL